MRVIEVFKSSATRPIEAIESIIAIVCLVFGIYLASPFYVSSINSAVSLAFIDKPVQKLFVAVFLFIIPSMPIILSLFFKSFATRQWRAHSMFAMFVAFIFLTILRLITIGLVPAVWLFTLALGLISAVCYLYTRVRGDSR